MGSVPHEGIQRQMVRIILSVWNSIEHFKFPHAFHAFAEALVNVPVIPVWTPQVQIIRPPEALAIHL